jgi:hypothetical protein
MSLGHGHTHRIGNTLTQRSGSHLDALGFTVLRMTWSPRIKLPEILYIFNGYAIKPG